MKKLTIYEKKLVATAYPLVEAMLEYFNLSDNSIEDWHGTICVWICESAVYWNKTEKKNPDSRNDKTDQNSRNNQKNTGAPKTGDDTGMMLWVWILLSAGGAAAALIIYRKRETI